MKIILLINCSQHAETLVQFSSLKEALMVVGEGQG